VVFGQLWIFPWWRFLQQLPYRRQYAHHPEPDQFGQGVGPVLQIAEGYTASLPEDVHQILNLRTDPSWPTTWFVPRLTGEGAFKDVYSVMANWGANHGAFSYGHIGADLITLASMLRIPVCMHNVDESKIFRPAVWNAFGMDKEGADYRACANFGPLYR
jgi:L-fucose isomerase